MENIRRRNRLRGLWRAWERYWLHFKWFVAPWTKPKGPVTSPLYGHTLAYALTADKALPLGQVGDYSVKLGDVFGTHSGQGVIDVAAVPQWPAQGKFDVEFTVDEDAMKTVTKLFGIDLVESPYVPEGKAFLVSKGAVRVGDWVFSDLTQYWWDPLACPLYLLDLVDTLPIWDAICAKFPERK